MTGRYAHNGGVRTNAGVPSKLNQQTSIQYLLRQSGYRTGIVGKYFNSWPLATNPPHFDTWATFSSSNKSYSGGQWNIQGTVQTVGQYATHFMGDQVEAFLSSASIQPWYLYVAPPHPHGPYTAEAKYTSAPVPAWQGNPAVFETDRSDKPAYVQSSKRTLSNAQGIRTKQLRTLMSVDDLIDRIMTKLQITGQLENTLVIFTSDHGFMWSEHGLSGKRFPYTQSVTVPLLVRWPGTTIAEATDTRLVGNIDLAPTALEAAGVAPPTSPPMDGRSLLTSGSRDRLLIEHWTDGGTNVPTWASLVTPSDQYVEYYSGTSVSFREYYDLISDPWQLQNLQVPPAGVPAQLAADRTCVGSSCP